MTVKMPAPEAQVLSRRTEIVRRRAGEHRECQRDGVCGVCEMSRGYPADETSVGDG